MSLALVARFAHLAAALALIGVFAAELLAGRTDRPTLRAWRRDMARLVRAALAVLAVSGVAVLARQAALATGRPGAALEPAAWWQLLTQSEFGAVWLLRHGLLLLLAALVLLKEREQSAADWLAWRLEGLVLAGAGAGAIAWAGHAAAAEPWAVPAPVADAVHVVAAGAWFGALLPLGLLLRRAAAEAGADARPFAVLAVRRFSRLSALLMAAVVVTGAYNSWVHVGGVAPLVGTVYGWLLSAKLAVLAGVAAVAAGNRRRLLAALGGDAATVGRPAMARLARRMAWEAGLALALVLLAGALGLAAPARHDTPTWPLGYRLSYEAAADLPGVRWRLIVGSQVAVLGAVAAIAAALVRAARWPLLSLGAVGVAGGLWLALPPLAVDAYPTTYARSTVPYHAASIAHGRALFAARCAACHGAGGRGDGPRGAGLPRRPADLTAPHTAQHTAGDLFWWIGRGIPRGGMPGFAAELSVDERWDVVNFLRALSAGEQARALGLVEPGRPWLAAPDFGFAVGPTPERTLKGFRGRQIVLIVLFTLPDSRPRLVELAEAYPALQALGCEVIAVPADADPQVLRRLGASPPLLFPVATDGAADIAAAYAVLARALTPESLLSITTPRHAEFLVDRQGYLRGRFIPGGGLPGWSSPRALLDQVKALDREAPAALAPDEHVH
jgi:putative copper resistance protein D